MILNAALKYLFFFFQENKRAARTHMTTAFCCPSSCSVSGFPESGQPGFGLWLAPLWPPSPVCSQGSSSAPFPCAKLRCGVSVWTPHDILTDTGNMLGMKLYFLNNFLPLGMAADIPAMPAFLWPLLHPHLPQIPLNNWDCSMAESSLRLNSH